VINDLSGTKRGGRRRIRPRLIKTTKKNRFKIKNGCVMRDVEIVVM